jgi:hypothetical protein
MFSLITARRKIARLVWFSAAVASLTVACERVPLLAPTGSTITLTTGVTALPANGSTEIIAQILEAAGTPPHSGTHITFFTTLGTVAPPDVETDVNGRVIVRFLAGDSNGTATITATSGGASTGANGGVKIAVGTAAVGRVTISANPASVPSNGGSTTIVADVFDINGNALNNAPVSFTTTAGSLANALGITNAIGRATTTLTTSQQATVTAAVGAQAPATTTPTPPPSTGSPTTPTTPTTPTSSGQASGSVTVTVSAVATLVITPPTTPPSAGLGASFKFTVTVPAQNSCAVREVTVDWGDGSQQSLGAVTGEANVSHVYVTDGTYTVSGTVTDACGNAATVSTAVTVIPVPRPGIQITFTPGAPRVGNDVTFTIQITVPAGIGVRRIQISYGDGQSDDLGGGTSAVAVHRYAVADSYTVRVFVDDTAGQQTQGTTRVTVSAATP